jgi:adenylate cyclase
MSRFTLKDIALRCFQGVSPAVLTTCDREGVPNVTYLSQVFFVDGKHVALSHQFFNKTKKNTMENPYASVQINDPATLETWNLYLRFDHEEREGPLFEGMSRRIDAIASHTGMTGIFKLRSADVYEVTRVERVDEILTPAAEGQELDVPTLHFRGELIGLQLVSQRLARATDLEGLLTTLLETLDEAFGFEHAMVLLLDETEQRLYAIASRGYGDGGIGAEASVGEGLIGTVARERSAPASSVRVVAAAARSLPRSRFPASSTPRRSSPFRSSRAIASSASSPSRAARRSPSRPGTSSTSRSSRTRSRSRSRT